MSSSLRLLILGYDYPPQLGGVATATSELARALSQTGKVKVKVIARRNSSQDQELQFDQNQPFSTVRIRLPSQAFLAIFPLAIHLLIQLFVFRPHAIFNPLWMPCSAATWLLRPLLHLKRIPYFTWIHGVEILESESSFKKRVRRRLSFLKARILSASKRVFSVSHFTAELAATRCGLSPSQLRVIPNGVDPQVFFPAPRSLKISEEYRLRNRFVFFTLTRLEDYKGVDTALKACRILKDHDLDFVYLIAGVGPDQERLERLIQTLELQDRVHLLGKIPQAELRDYYNTSDVFVLLSRCDWSTPNFEGFGIVFLEAAACGKPAIGGQSGGVPEAIENEVSGILVDPQDATEVAQVMQKFLNDPHWRRQLAEGALGRAQAQFTWQKVAAQVLEDLCAE